MVAVLGALLVAGGIAVSIALINGDEVGSRGPSMRPTLIGRDALEIDTRAFVDAAPERGHVVTAQAPAGIRLGECGVPRRRGEPCAAPTPGYARQRVLKRVIALPGDRVAFAGDGGLILNGERADEPFIRPCRIPCPLRRPIAVPPGHYFLAGDNRPVSFDSRDWGPVPLEAIDGRVILGEASE